MERTFTTGPASRVSDDVLIYLVPEDGGHLSRLSKRLDTSGVAGVAQAVATGDFTGTFQQLHLSYGKGRRTSRTLLVGLGKRGKLTPERLRKACASGAKKARGLKVSSFTIVVPRDLPRSAEWFLAAFEGADLALYAFDTYKKKGKDAGQRPERFTIHSENRKHATAGTRAAALADGVIAGTRLARDLSNAPGNEIYPESLAEAARLSASRNAYSATVLDEHDIAEENMGGVLAVGRGSSRPPRFIILEYGPTQRRPVVLVGKGVTFDTGGISIKPSAGMGEMKMDMAGAAAVIGTFEAVSRMRLPVHVIGLVPAVENMPDGSAQRPGDIIRHLSGKTSEVDNTDAEGRLILADALAYAERFNPAAVIDLATLTGAVVVALGHVTAGMMGNDERVMKLLAAAGDRTYERVWQLPLFEEYASLIRSDVADVKNVGGRWAGAITAAMFLKAHIGSYPWVHLDIAGTAMLESDGDYTQRGGSGFGVRLLADFLRRWK